jgi:diacylglycerol kinase (ATP)
MRVTLVHSQSAGEGVASDGVRSEIESAGHEIIAVHGPETATEELLRELPEHLAAAGGDGTIWRAASALIGRRIPLAILPLGTANNIARSLGISGSVAELAAGWAEARRRKLDLGVVNAARGEARFVEGVGGGLVSRAIAAMIAEPPGDDEEHPGRKVEAAVGRYREILADLVPTRSEVTVDGIVIADEFLLLEVLNIPRIGPNLFLSSEADPFDGFLHVVMARESDRGELEDFLRDRASGHPRPLAVRTVPGRDITIEGWDEMHVDDEVRLGSSIGTVSLSVEPAALRVLA